MDIDEEQLIETDPEFADIRVARWHSWYMRFIHKVNRCTLPLEDGPKK